MIQGRIDAIIRKVNIYAQSNRGMLASLIARQTVTTMTQFTVYVPQHLHQGMLRYLATLAGLVGGRVYTRGDGQGVACWRLDGVVVLSERLA